jgi:Na+-transporting NADH:ubiquinone oxidoreductase subunit NqrC
MSNRQRADESFRRSQENLQGALAMIKASKAEADQNARQALADKMTQQGIEANAMKLDDQKQERGLIAMMGDVDARPAGMQGPALPGEMEGMGPLTNKAAGEKFKFQTIAKLRTMRGKEATPEQVQQEYETQAAQARETQAAASAAPKLRDLNIRNVESDIAGRNASTAKTKKETELLGQPKPEDLKDLAGMEDNLRQEMLKHAGEYVKVRDAHSRIKSVTKNPSAAGDLALIFNFMKMLDPGSTVRETEFANAENAKGVDENIRSVWNKLKTGERLTEEQRKDFLGQAEGLFTSQKAFADQAKGYYGELAKRRGLNADNVIKVLDMPGEGGGKVGRFMVEVGD